MQTKIQYPYTREQFDALNSEQQQVIKAVAEYLNGFPGSPAASFKEEAINKALNLLKPCHGCVPQEEAEGDLLAVIRKKFGAVYAVASELAERELIQKGLRLFDQFSLCVVIDPSVDDATHVVIVDYKRPATYLHEWSKAWQFKFASLVHVAKEVLRVKNHLVEQITNACKPRELMLVLENGMVREVVDLPDNIQVTVIDYNVEAADPRELTASPLDGELCRLTKF